MRRRSFLLLAGAGGVGTLVACTVGGGPDDGGDDGDDPGGAPDAGADARAGDAAPDACTPGTVLLHDTHAQALYLDGSHGPLTGICRVAYVTAGAAVTLDFWHGHGGVLHRWTLEPAHLAALKRRERIYVTTTRVDGHDHRLFVDPVDEAYRVAGAPDVPVPLDDC